MNRIDDHEVLRRAAGVRYRSLGDGDGGVLLDEDSGASAALNGMGALVWEVLDEPMPFSAFVARVGGRVDGGLDDAAVGELRMFVSALSDQGLVEIAAPDSQR